MATPIVPLAPFQVAAVESAARFTWNNWSRQTGKSFTFALRRLVRGMQRNRNQIFLSASGRQSRELMLTKVIPHLRAIRAAVDCTFEETPTESFFEGTKITVMETRVKARNNAFDFRVIALPANPDTARGYTGDVFLDEFAMHEKSKEIYGSIFPTLLRGGGEMDICSTPKGRGNMFYRLKDNEVFTRQTLTIEDAIAAGLDVDLKMLLAGMTDEDLIAQEFYCEFLDEAMVFLSHEQIAALEDAALTTAWDAAKIESCADEELYVGYDVGRRKDLSVIWIWGRPKGVDVLYTRGVVVMHATRFSVQEQALHDVMRLPNARRLAIDETGLGMDLAERMQDRYGETRVEKVTFTAANKAAMAERMKNKTVDVRLRIPSEPDIRNDWHSIRRDVLPSGQFRFTMDAEADVTGHADRFWAAALGVRAATSAGAYVPLQFESCGGGQFGRSGSIHGTQYAGDDDEGGSAGGWG